MGLDKGELLNAILAAVEKHPNTKVGKLIKCVESERTRKNIVLLLIELAEHPEFASNTSISLKYYLDMFEDLPEETSFTEAGLLLLNSALIYGKRVDNVHLAVEKLILSLTSTENIDEKRHDTSPNTIPKTIRRGKKRPSEELCGPYEADMSTKRFKTLSYCKRFDDGLSNSSKKNTDSFIESRLKAVVSLSNEFNHPTVWKYSVIEDYDYDDEVDSKKNYKLFTYHLEHRYNTLIPDINFKMYFKMKDFIDAECRDSNHFELWPPLSDAYIEHYVNLENQILYKDGHDTNNQFITQGTRCNSETRVQYELPHMSIFTHLHACEGSLPESVEHTDSQVRVSEIINLNRNNKQDKIVLRTDSVVTDSGIEEGSIEISEHQKVLTVESGISSETLHDNTVKETKSVEAGEKLQLSDEKAENADSINKFIVSVESEIEENATKVKLISNDILPSHALCKSDHDSSLLLNSKYENEDLSTIKVILPHLDDEGVFFSDLDERDQQLLSPAVVATDVFRCVKDKSNIIVMVDDVIKKMYNIQEPQQEILTLPVFSCREYSSLPLNILKIHHKYLKKRRTFKLGSEFHMLKRERHKKYSRETKHPIHPLMRVRLSEDVNGVPLSPLSSPSYEPDFYGFPEEAPNDKNRTLSRDSGISLQQIESTSDKEVNDDFKECIYTLHSTLQSRCFESLLESEFTSGNQEHTLKKMEAVQLPEANEKSDDVVGSEKALCNETMCEQIEPNSKDNDLAEYSKINLRTTISENLPLVMSKVQEWHTHLQPILAQSRDRHHFDVFELGNDIMGQFDRRDVSNKIISLNHVIENKDSSLISRYFLSMLLLANQGNISININNKSSEMPSELNDVELRLLSKKRNIVSLEDNIGFGIPQTSIDRSNEESMLTNIRTLKPVHPVSQTEDRDSGISMSDRFGI